MLLYDLKTVPFLGGTGSDPAPNNSLWAPKSTLQTASRSVQPFPQVSRSRAAAPAVQTYKHRQRQTAVASELCGQGGGTLYAPSSGLVPPVIPSQSCGLRQNFKQTTLTTRLYKVRTNLYPPPTYENVPTRLRTGHATSVAIGRILCCA